MRPFAQTRNAPRQRDPATIKDIYFDDATCLSLPISSQGFFNALVRSDRTRFDFDQIRDAEQSARVALSAAATLVQGPTSISCACF